MIAALEFGEHEPWRDRTLRRARFVRRSSLPLSAACLIANGVRETLGRLLACDLEVEVLTPAIPDARARRLLVASAELYRVRGRLCDALIVVRAADARRLVARAFGEEETPARRPLSSIESATLERVVHGLAPLCSTLCGTLGPVSNELADRAACDLATYFEVRTIGVVSATIGFGLTRDPEETVCDCLTIDDLASVEICGAVELASGALSVPAFSRLSPGVTIALDAALGQLGTLRFGDVTFARGACGSSEGRRSLRIEETP
jgi:hypothetical protein